MSAAGRGVKLRPAGGASLAACAVEPRRRRLQRTAFTTGSGTHEYFGGGCAFCAKIFDANLGGAASSRVPARRNAQDTLLAHASGSAAANDPELRRRMRASM